jgi:DUF4097 and DUF4098 domain-containing protein YvlB
MNRLTINLLTLTLLIAAAPVAADDIREVRDAASDGRIEFSAVTGEMTVIGHDADEFILEGYLGDDVEELVIEGDPSNWRIELEPVENDAGRNADASELTLYVPRGSELRLGTVSGDISIRDLSGPALEVESVSGDLTLENVDSTEIEIDAVSGRIQADAVAGEENDYRTVSGNIEIRGARGRINIKTVSGQVSVEAEAVSDLESESVSGDLQARLSPNAGASLNVSSHSAELELHLDVDETPRIRAETYSGHIDSDFGEVRESGHGSGESLQTDGGANAVEVEAKSFSGSVTIRRMN